jgi:hypothetical protein
MQIAESVSSVCILFSSSVFLIVHCCTALYCTVLQVKRLRDQIEDHICKGGPPVREEGKEGGGPFKSFARSGPVSQPVQAG